MPEDLRSARRRQRQQHAKHHVEVAVSRARQNPAVLGKPAFRFLQQHQQPVVSAL